MSDETNANKVPRPVEMGRGCLCYGTQDDCYISSLSMRRTLDAYERATKDYIVEDIGNGPCVRLFNRKKDGTKGALLRTLWRQQRPFSALHECEDCKRLVRRSMMCLYHDFKHPKQEYSPPRYLCLSCRSIRARLDKKLEEVIELERAVSRLKRTRRHETA